jgi:hypothetical protein
MRAPRSELPSILRSVARRILGIDLEDNRSRSLEHNLELAMIRARRWLPACFT